MEDTPTKSGLKEVSHKAKKNVILVDLKRIASLHGGKVSTKSYKDEGRFSNQQIWFYFKAGLKTVCGLAGVEFDRAKDYDILERDLKIAQLVRDGATYESVGKKYALTRERVRQIISKYGIKNTRRINAILKYRELTSEEREKALQMRLNGANFRLIADTLCLALSHVSSLSEKEKWPFGKKCIKCGVQVTEKNKAKNYWKYCANCWRKINNKRCLDYFVKRYRNDKSFRKMCLKRNQQYIESRKEK